MKFLRLLRVALPLFLIVFFLQRNDDAPEPWEMVPASGRRESVTRVAALFSKAPEAFADWVRRYQLNPREADLNVGRALAKERRAVLKSLIELDPERALAEAISEDGRAGLPAEIQELLEIPFSTGGGFERVVSCYLDGLERPDGAPEEERFVTFGGERYRAFTYGRRAELQTKDWISLHGIFIDDVAALSPDPVKIVAGEDGLVVEAFGEIRRFGDEDELDRYVAMQLEDEGTPGPGTQSDFAESAWTEGTKRILYLRVRFADDDADFEPVSLVDAQSHQDDVAEHYRIASYGKLNVTTVFPDMINLSENKSEYVGQALGKMMNEARALAITMGNAQGEDWDYENYDLYTIVSDRGIGSYAGVAQVGGRKSHHQRGYTSLRTSGHEFGHNLGLPHAHFNYTSDLSPRGSTPTDGLGRVEYGHRFSVMSAQSGSDMNNPLLPHFTVHEKWRLDWVTDSDKVDIEGKDQNGTYRLFQNDDEEATGLKALRLPSGGALSRYWLSYRTAWRQPNRSSDNDYLLNGVLFNWTGSGGGSSTLLDMTPYSDPGSTGGSSWTRDNSDKWDAPLLIGRTYTDPDSKVSVTPMARGGAAPDEYIDVYVHLGVGETISLVEENDTCQAVIPGAATATGTDWTAIGFDDSGWPYSGALGVGYDTGSDYNPYFGVDVLAMRRNNESCYLRIPFTIGEEVDPAEIESLKLLMRYDDGFVAYLNGVKIAEDHAPPSPVWNSGATSNHSDGDAVEYQEFSGNAALGALVTGTNVLAIHGLNNGTSSSDFLIQPRLTATLSASQNEAPTVSLEASTVIAAVNQDITFTASGSDPEGDLLAWSWDYDIGDAFTPEGLNSPVAVRRFESAGHYVVTVTCSDRKGGIDRARVLVKVGEPSNIGVVRGRVLQGGQPVAGARVFVEGSDAQCVTLNDGSYLMVGLSTTSATTLGAMFDGDVFQPSLEMPLTPDPVLDGVDFLGHATAPPGAPAQVMTVSPNVTETDTGNPVQLEAHFWDNTLGDDVLIPFGDMWSYLDSGIDPGSGWTALAFDDSGWASGPAELGYGDGQATEIGFGSDPENRHITTWFRRKFTVADVSEVSRLKLSVKRDDGIRVFLNGIEIARDNLTTGTVSAGTKARNEVSPSNQDILISFIVDPDVLVEGENVISAEVHQEDDDSGDLSFDLELAGARNLTAASPEWAVSPSGASVSPEGLFQATLPGSYVVTATSGGLTAEARIEVSTDNEVTLMALDEFVRENEGGSTTFRVLRSGSTQGALVVPLGVGGDAEEGVDYSVVPSSVTLPAGALTAEFSITPLDDEIVEGEERVTVTVLPDALFSIGSPGVAVVTFIDDENETVDVPEAGVDFMAAEAVPITLNGSTLSEEVFVEAGDYWKFNDGGAEPPAGWRGLPFADEAWKEGMAKFGYGDGDEVTTVDFGTSSSSKHITTFFRRRFYLDDPLDYEELRASLLVDDGAIIYLNGQEVERINLPGGTVGFTTRAQGAVGGDDEETFFDWELDPAVLIAGENIIVVEVHQSSQSSSDLGFDLALRGRLVAPQVTGPVQWRKRSGPGTASFGNATDVASQVTFDQAGTYVLELEAVNSGATDEVTITVEAGLNYLNWVGGFAVSDSQQLGDPDGDGLVNLLEYALVGDPTTGSEKIRPTLSEDLSAEGDLLFSYRRLRETSPGDGSGTTGQGYEIYGIRYTVQAAESFGTWADASAVMTVQEAGAPVDQGDGSELVTLRLTPPAPAGRKWFVRLKVEEQ